jgi:hypothetical protein
MFDTSRHSFLITTKTQHFMFLSFNRVHFQNANFLLKYFTRSTEAFKTVKLLLYNRYRTNRTQVWKAIKLRFGSIKKQFNSIFSYIAVIDPQLM